MSQITTHVLDTALGLPAKNVPITLAHQQGKTWQNIASGTTDDDGRISDLLADDVTLTAGVYRMTFDTARYFSSISAQGFYPYVDVIFVLTEQVAHYHIPLLLSPYGYSTYRGS